MSPFYLSSIRGLVLQFALLTGVYRRFVHSDDPLFRCTLSQTHTSDKATVTTLCWGDGGYGCPRHGWLLSR